MLMKTLTITLLIGLFVALPTLADTTDVLAELDAAGVSYVYSTPREKLMIITTSATENAVNALVESGSLTLDGVEVEIVTLAATLEAAYEEQN